MISISNLPPLLFRTNPNSNPRCRLHLKTSRSLIHSTSFCALKTESSGGDYSPDLLKKPLISPSSSSSSSLDEQQQQGSTKNGRFSELSSEEGYHQSGGGDDDKREREEDDWVDWEDQILEDTVPLVGFVRMLLHSGKYRSGDKLSPEHEKTILERVLPYHPEFEKKIGCGIDYIKVDYHPDFEDSRCLFIVRKDGQSVDFSYWKCIKGLIKKNYPLYANSFIVRHFRRASSRNI